jgi:hypothetical protein
MKLYNNLFASSYRFYSRFKDESPLGTSICIIWICQMILFFLVFAILKKIIHFNPFLLLPNKFYFLPVFFLWLYLLTRYYSKVKVQLILQGFEKKSHNERKIWGLITIVCFIAPLIVITFLLKK